MEKVIENQLLQAAKIVEEQLDNEIAQLEQMGEDDFEVLREKRLEALKKQQSLKQEWLTQGHGQYSEICDEKEFFDVCKKSNQVVCNFYREATFRCKIIDKHLEILAPKHLETKFCRINAEKSPFLTERLKIKILPNVALIKDAKTKDFIVGFDDLGGVDDFSTEMLEWRIAQADVISYSGDLLNAPGSGDSRSRNAKSLLGKQTTKIIRGRDDEDSDDDD